MELVCVQRSGSGHANAALLKSEKAYALSSDAVGKVYIAGNIPGAFDGQVSEGYSEVFVKFNASGVW